MFKIGNIPWNKNKKYSKEAKKKISNTLKKKYKSGVLINGFKGKKHSKEQILKMKQQRHTDEMKNRISDTLKKKYKNGEIIHPMLGKKHSNSAIIKMSESHKNMSDETRKKIGLAAKGRTPWNKGIPRTPESIKKEIETKRKNGTLNLKHTEYAKKKISKTLKYRYKIGELKAYIRTLEARKRHSERVSGDKSNFWKGGKSFEEYGFGFKPMLKNYIREIDNHKCRICGIEEKHIGKKLSVHHIDYNKKNCSVNNLISLCHHCHAKTSVNREKWEPKLKKKREGYNDKSVFRFL